MTSNYHTVPGKMLNMARKHQTLEEFSKIIHEHNPMRFSEDVLAEDEYDPEALSILSRFSESALNLCPDEGTAREIAVNMVRQCFEFWFNASEVKDIEKLAFRLLDAFKASFSQSEQL